MDLSESIFTEDHAAATFQALRVEDGYERAARMMLDYEPSLLPLAFSAALASAHKLRQHSALSGKEERALCCVLLQVAPLAFLATRNAYADTLANHPSACIEDAALSDSAYEQRLGIHLGAERVALEELSDLDPDLKSYLSDAARVAVHCFRSNVRELSLEIEGAIGHECMRIGALIWKALRERYAQRLAQLSGGAPRGPKPRDHAA